MTAIKSILAEDRVLVWDRNKAKIIFEEGFFGKLKEDRLELALIEACYLLQKDTLKIVGIDKKKIIYEDFYNYCCSIDPRFPYRYAVYKDLRDRELPTRSGFKFGCDFRVYKKGANPMKRGKKQVGEHTKWIVFAVPEGFIFSFPELSRAVRLAHNIRANMLWAIVDPNKACKYYKVEFFKP